MEMSKFNKENPEERKEREEREYQESRRIEERKLTDNSLAIETYGLDIQDFSGESRFKYIRGEFGKMLYNYNNGITAFVDSNGELFVSPDPKKESELYDFGYKKSSSLFVPFSNGETPSDRDQTVKDRWEKLLKKFK